MQKAFWILGGVLGGCLLLAVVFFAFVPLLVIRWLGGEDFRRLASEQLSQVLHTKGDLSPLQWSSFSVFAGSFISQNTAPGPWAWDIREIRTEVSPRLLLDRILRFSDISIGSISLSPMNMVAVPLAPEPAKPSRATTSQELFRDVQIEKLEVRSLSLAPAPVTNEWGCEGVQVFVFPGKQKTDFTIQGGRILSPFPFLGKTSIQQAKGRYDSSFFYLTELVVKSERGGSLSASGDLNLSHPFLMHGQLAWEKWDLPGQRVGFGLFDVPAKTSGEFTLDEWKPSGFMGQGKIHLVDARLEPAEVGSKSLLRLLSFFSGEPRLLGCPLSIAEASFKFNLNHCEINKIQLEAPGLIRIVGQVGILGEELQGKIDLGLGQNLGSKVSILTGGELFGRHENGYYYQPVQISGTLENPQNDLQDKLVKATAKTTIRVGAQILEKVAGANSAGSRNDAADQVLKGLRSLIAPTSP